MFLYRQYVYFEHNDYMIKSTTKILTNKFEMKDSRGCKYHTINKYFYDI
jgi:hypothetical protein